MLFDMKSIVLYGLVALATASPLPELAKRAKLKTDYLCPDGTTLSQGDVRTAYHECRNRDDGAVSKRYPAYFGNQSSGQKVLVNVPDGTKLREFPIIMGDKYTGGPPGKYRVVTDYNGNGDFRGVMQHTGSAVGGAYTACTPVTKEDKKEEKKEEKEEKKDEKKEKKEEKKDENQARSVQATETEMTEKSASHTVSNLDTRAKKKKIGSATCDDGVTLTKDDVANAYKECKKLDDYGAGGYPHSFGNKSGADEDVFAGVTKDLREYPIIQGGTWTNGKPPGKYRVVIDYNKNFVGVMIEGAGASFSRCTINND